MHRQTAGSTIEAAPPDWCLREICRCIEMLLRGHDRVGLTALREAAREHVADFDWSRVEDASGAVDEQFLAELASETAENVPTKFGVLALQVGCMGADLDSEMPNVRAMFLRARALAHRSRTDVELLLLAGCLVIEAVSLLTKFGEQERASVLLCDLDASVQAHKGADPDGLVAFAGYQVQNARIDALISRLAARQLIDETERRHAAEELRDQVDQLTPLAEAVAAHMRSSDRDGAESAAHGIELHLRHRQVTAQAAVEWAEGGLGTSASVAGWLTLAEEQDANGSVADATRAVVAGIDHIFRLIAWDPRREGALHGDLRRLRDALLDYSAREAQPPVGQRLLALTYAARAEAVLGLSVEATAHIRDAVALAQDSATFAVEGILVGAYVNADDLLGVALMVEERTRGEPGPGPEYEAATRALCGRPLPSADGRADRFLALLQRTSSSVGLLSTGERRWNALRAAQPVWQALEHLRRQGVDDVRHCRKTGALPATGAAWRGVLEQLKGQLGLERLLANVGPRVVVGGHGANLLAPWPGLLVDEQPAITSVLCEDIEAKPPAARPQPESGVLLLNGCLDVDPLHPWLDGLGAAVGAAIVDCRSAEDVRRELNASDAGLIVLGFHGSQAGVLGRFTLEIAGRTYAADDVWNGVSLPRASTFLIFSCFGGGGQLMIDHDWHSLPRYALQAGAKAAITCRWPAWFEPRTRVPLQSLGRQLSMTATSPDAWAAGEAVVEFMKAVRNAGPDDPRPWAGWATWTTSAWL